MDIKNILEYDDIEKSDILETLSDAINTCDDAGNYGIGDKLLTIIHILKYNWNMEL